MGLDDDQQLASVRCHARVDRRHQEMHGVFRFDGEVFDQVPLREVAQNAFVQTDLKHFGHRSDEFAPAVVEEYDAFQRKLEFARLVIFRTDGARDQRGLAAAPCRSGENRSRRTQRADRQSTGDEADRKQNHRLHAECACLAAMGSSGRHDCLLCDVRNHPEGYGSNVYQTRSADFVQSIRPQCR